MTPLGRRFVVILQRFGFEIRKHRSNQQFQPAGSRIHSQTVTNLFVGASNWEAARIEQFSNQ